MLQKDLERAFGNSDKTKWTESQRRIVFHLEYAEKTIQKLQSELASFKEAAAIEWLRNVNQSLIPKPYIPQEDDD